MNTRKTNVLETLLRWQRIIQRGWQTFAAYAFDPYFAVRLVPLACIAALGLSFLLFGGADGNKPESDDSRSPSLLSLNAAQRLPLHLSCVSSIAGSEVGISPTCLGVRSLVEEVNGNGGVNGQRVELSLHNDQGEQSRAVDIATRIASDEKTLIVIGHETGVSSQSAFELYRKNHLPVLNPTLTQAPGTRDNPWLFSTAPDIQSQTDVVAGYLSVVRGMKRIGVVHSNDPGGIASAVRFATRSKALGTNVISQQPYDRDAKSLALRVLGRRLAAMKDLDAVVLFAPSGEMERLVSALKSVGMSIPIVGAGRFTSSVATVGMGDPDNDALGWAENLLVPLPFAIDGVSSRARNAFERYRSRVGRKPPWQAVFGYDAASLVVDTISKGLDQGGSVRKVRASLRHMLSQRTTLETAFEGLSGRLYFDRKRRVQHATTMSIIYDGRLQALPRQISLIETAQQARLFSNEGRQVFELGGQLASTAEIARVGIRLASIDAVDRVNRTFDATIMLWLNAAPSFDPVQLDFPDAVAPLKFEKPTVRRVDSHGMYATYKAKGKFRFPVSADDLISGERKLRIRFRHGTKDQSALSLLLDDAEAPFVDPDNRLGVLPVGMDMKISTTGTMERIVPVSTFGDPAFRNNTRAFSSVEASVTLVPKGSSLRAWFTTLMPSGASWLALIAVGLCAIPLFTKAIKVEYPVISGLQRMTIGTLLLFLLDSLIRTTASTSLDPDNLETLLRLSGILWWIVLGYWIVRLLPTFVWQPLEKSTGAPVPAIARTFVNLAVWVAIFLAIMANIFDKPLTSFWAASGVLTIVLGIALQSLILDAFAGLMINLERPFRHLQWIRLQGSGAGDQFGQVYEQNWRTTRIWTLDNNLISIPNSLVSRANIVNHSVPTAATRIQPEIVLDFSIPPQQARDVIMEGLHEAAEFQGILTKPAPKVAVGRWEYYGIRYIMSAYIDMSIVTEPGATTAIADEVMAALARHGLNVARPYVAFAGSEHQTQDAARASNQPLITSSAAPSKVVAVAPEHDAGPLTEKQIELVTSSWKEVRLLGETVGELFYGRLFEQHPEVKPLFKTNTEEQARKLLKMINLSVHGLNHFDNLTGALEDLGMRHMGYGVTDEQYAYVGEALIWTLAEGLGDAFTPETNEAWTTLYDAMADAMKSAMAE